jgi:hypothetical protein
MLSCWSRSQTSNQRVESCSLTGEADFGTGLDVAEFLSLQLRFNRWSHRMAPDGQVDSRPNEHYQPRW